MEDTTKWATHDVGTKHENITAALVYAGERLEYPGLIRSNMVTPRSQWHPRVNRFACSDVKIQMFPAFPRESVVTRSPRMPDVRSSSSGMAKGLGNLAVSQPTCFLLMAWQLGTERMLQLNDFFSVSRSESDVLIPSGGSTYETVITLPLKSGLADDVDQTDNTPLTWSAPQPCIKPRHQESVLIKVRQRPSNMQHVTVSYQSQTVCVSVGLSSDSVLPINGFRPLYLSHSHALKLSRSLVRNIAVVFPSSILNNRQHCCNTPSVPSCHVTRRKDEGWDTAMLPKARQESSIFERELNSPLVAYFALVQYGNPTSTLSVSVHYHIMIPR
ncbi:hypothetical protein T265_11900 [Opisthorchis viverrini]|uniref:Uncharacterized protein n=1 Tax=Opisthorchis viverrini TaxID=6198 RepID=A0A074ZVS3_OPIVI|nr:hypothetical protein T265_11900 [Opisthorchis viverrini]KER19269.1 hypothetical protein T265_11900 [Opisthorchis viverrini]